jgi:23S rRNA pseudouridine2605 synthase
MRINKFLAQATGMSRRAADKAVDDGLVLIDGTQATTGHDVSTTSTVLYDGTAYSLSDIDAPVLTIVFNKPTGYVVSRNGQGSRTIYELLPPEFQLLKPIGRLDKDSSGLLLLTNDGQLANQLTHPSFQKIKVYQISLNKDLAPLHRQMISDHGIQLEDGLSQLLLERPQTTLQTAQPDDRDWQVTMREGRNRQIRRTFESLGYVVKKLHRIQFGNYRLEGLKPGQSRPV